MTQSKAGQIVWHDLFKSDRPCSMAFYQHVANWTYEVERATILSRETARRISSSHSPGTKRVRGLPRRLPSRKMAGSLTSRFPTWTRRSSASPRSEARSFGSHSRCRVSVAMHSSAIRSMLWSGFRYPGTA